MFLSLLPSPSSCLGTLPFPVFGMRVWSESTTTSKRKTKHFTESRQAFWRKRTCCIFLVCWFLLSLETTGEPHSHDSDSKIQAPATYLGQPPMSVSDSYDASREITMFPHQTTTKPIIRNQHDVVQYGNQSNFAKESAASVIASSFRNVDTQTISSNEEVGVGQQKQGSKKKSKSCDLNVLKGCLEAIPPMNDTGIPSTAQAVSTACRIYDNGMSCFDRWSKICLVESHRQKVKASITGAHEMYSFLCKDPKFRADYLKHKDCYKKLSPHWDECSRGFIDGLRKNTKHNHTAFCCIRLEFLACVSKRSSYLCTLDATRFLLKMAETLVRSSLRSHIPDHCVNIKSQNCIPINGAESLLNHPYHPLQIYFISVPSSYFLLITLYTLHRFFYSDSNV